MFSQSGTGVVFWETNPSRRLAAQVLVPVLRRCALNILGCLDQMAAQRSITSRPNIQNNMTDARQFAIEKMNRIACDDQFYGTFRMKTHSHINISVAYTA
jgi:hypothetical protein